MRYIVVQWFPEEEYGYKKAMSVIRSNHPRFVDGSRFDFGFLNIASCEGYVITILPSKETLDDSWKNGGLVKEGE